jgi:polar amino acid transport system permease protein
MGSGMIDVAFIQQIFPRLLEGASVTLFIAGVASAIGFIGGTILGVAQSSPSKPLRYAITGVVTIIRGTPMLLQIMFFYFMLSHIGIHISALKTAIIAIGINSSAYISQIIRSGIASVSRGQIEAGQTLGLSRYDITRYIVLPQAVRTVLPALGNEFVTLIKDSSLASVIGVLELYQQGQIIISQVFSSLTVYAVIGLIYLAMTTTVSLLVLKLEHSLNNHA